jgi:integrative and conjugative element protein (TIGR02256 family)
MQILLPVNIKMRLKRLLLCSGSREIGGILMGEEIEDNLFRVVDFSVDAVTGSSAHFVRDAIHHDQELEAFFERTDHNYSRFNYLGEWHSHPLFDVEPSGQDIHSMQGLVDGSRGVDFAVLLIVRLKWFAQLESHASLHVTNYEPQFISII